MINTTQQCLSNGERTLGVMGHIPPDILGLFLQHKFPFFQNYVQYLFTCLVIQKIL